VSASRRKFATLRSYEAFGRSPAQALRYLAFDRELDNFTYEIANTDELVTFISEALAVERYRVAAWLAELDADRALESSIADALRRRSDRNRRMPFGRRAGWYAVVRATKPRLVVETGIHDGLGSAVLLRALERNSGEGIDGTLASFDVRRDVGWLVPGWLRVRHEVSLITGLSDVAGIIGDRAIDVFIHDSDHRYPNERAELQYALSRAAPGSVLISDNAHAGEAFRDFCEANGLVFRLFKEQPRDHFYRGAGIGLTTTPR
jgi:predicted O-methyltransferase YrrM